MSTDDRTQQHDDTQDDVTQQLDVTDHDRTQQLDVSEPSPVPSTPAPTTRPLPTTTEDLMDTEWVTSPVTAPTTGPTPTDTTGTTRTTGTTGTSTASPTAPEPVWTAVTAEPRGVRVGTVVWGLVIAAIGVGLLAFASGVVFDVELALIGLVAAAGVALLVGSLMSGRRRRGR